MPRTVERERKRKREITSNRQLTLMSSLLEPLLPSDSAVAVVVVVLKRKRFFVRSSFEHQKLHDFSYE